MQCYGNHKENIQNNMQRKTYTVYSMKRLLYICADIVQGDPNRNFSFQMALQLKQCIFDPKLVKSKLVWKAVVFYGRKKFFEKSWKVKSFSKNNEFFLLFLKIQFLLQKTTASQTNFGFTNIGLNMQRFSQTDIYFR